MVTSSRIRAAAVVVVLAAGAAAQEVTVTLRDGSVAAGVVERCSDGRWTLRIDGVSTQLPQSELLGLHAAPPRPVAAATAFLVGGAQICGEPRAGDPGGETLVIASRSLGPVPVLVDRLAALVLHAEAGAAAGAGDFSLAGGDRDEAVFFRARRGFDAVRGAIHRFSADGIVFAADGAASPRLYDYASIAAVALHGGIGRDGAATAQVLTRAGDVLDVDVAAADADGLSLVGEGGRPLRLEWGELAALTFLGADRLFLSDLEPAAVREGAYLSDGDTVLYRWRRDRTVTGGFLAVAGVTFGKGIGVHSRCELDYSVPPQATHFFALVGVDDEVRRLRARGIVDVAVLEDGRELAGRGALASGEPAVNLGALPVRPGATLTLRVAFGPGLDLGDRVDWLQAVFLCRR